MTFEEVRKSRSSKVILLDADILEEFYFLDIIEIPEWFSSDMEDPDSERSLRRTTFNYALHGPSNLR